MACYAVIMTIVVDKCCSEVGEALKCVNRKLKCGGHVKTRRLRSFPPCRLGGPVSRRTCKSSQCKLGREEIQG